MQPPPVCISAPHTPATPRAGLCCLCSATLLGSSPCWGLDAASRPEAGALGGSPCLLPFTQETLPRAASVPTSKHTVKKHFLGFTTVNSRRTVSAATLPPQMLLLRLKVQAHGSHSPDDTTFSTEDKPGLPGPSWLHTLSYVTCLDSTFFTVQSCLKSPSVLRVSHPAVLFTLNV